MSAAPKASRLYERAHAAAGVSHATTGDLLGVSAEYVDQLCRTNDPAAVTVRDVVAGPTSVCRAVGYELAAIASPAPPCRSPLEQAARVSIAAAELQRVTLDAWADGVVEPHEEAAIARAALAVHDATTGVQALARIAAAGR